MEYKGNVASLVFSFNENAWALQFGHSVSQFDHKFKPGDLAGYVEPAAFRALAVETNGSLAVETNGSLAGPGLSVPAPLCNGAWAMLVGQTTTFLVVFSCVCMQQKGPTIVYPILYPILFVRRLTRNQWFSQDAKY